jgi:predicted RND superfamily exporter protein
MTPVLIGLLWLFQLMPSLDLELNLANFFCLPILIGCAVDGAVHMIHRFRETGSTADVGRTTGTAVCLASLSNMLGFASMGIARHRGVSSLGIVTALGCATIMIAIVILLPSLIEVVERGKLRPPRAPGSPAD